MPVQFNFNGFTPGNFNMPNFTSFLGKPSFQFSQGLQNGLTLAPRRSSAEIKEEFERLYKNGEDPELNKNNLSGNNQSGNNGSPATQMGGASRTLLGKSASGASPTTTYEEFEKFANGVGNRMSGRESREAADLLGLTNFQRRNFKRAVNAGRDVSGYLGNVLKKSYIKNGQIYTEGMDGYNADDLALAKYQGTNATEVANAYNKAVTDWRAGEITYDPATGKYMAQGFNDGFGNDGKIDVTNSSWFKDDVDRQRTIQQNMYYNDVNNFSDQNILNPYLNDNLSKTLGLPEDYNTLTDDQKLIARQNAANTLLKNLDTMRQSTDGTFNYQGNVLADAIMKYLIEQQRNGSAPEWLGNLSFNTNGLYGKISNSKQLTGAFGLLAKAGAVLNKIKKYDQGGISGAGQGGGSRSYTAFSELTPEQLQDLRNAGLQFKDKLGLTASPRGYEIFTNTYKADLGFMGINTSYNGYYKYRTPDGQDMYVNRLDGTTYIGDPTNGGEKLDEKVQSNWARGFTDMTLDKVYLSYRLKKNQEIDSYNELLYNDYMNGVMAQREEDEKKEKEKERKETANSSNNRTILALPSYHSLHYSVSFKNGGNLNMHKINYFQAGGPAQAAPADGGQDILAQIMQLVQAAMSGDEQATQQIQQIMQAAQQGDQLAAQIAQMIQEIAQQMQGQAAAAKNGAKLAYIHSLKTGCPAGYEVSYRREGGRVCKECVKKACDGTKAKKAQEGTELPAEKCGGKTKKAKRAQYGAKFGNQGATPFSGGLYAPVVKDREVRLPSGARISSGFGADGGLVLSQDVYKVPFAQPETVRTPLYRNPFRGHGAAQYFDPDIEVTKEYISVPADEYDAYQGALNNYENQLIKKHEAETASSAKRAARQLLR